MTTLNSLYEDLWQRLAAAAAGRTAAFRLPVVASASPEGEPAARIMVLRAAMAETASLRLYTDRRSEKMQQWATPEGTVPLELVFYDPDRQEQVRCVGQGQVLGADKTAALWAALPLGQRLVYCADPAPGTVVATAESGLPEILRDPQATEAAKLAATEQAASRFVAIDIAVDRMDWLKIEPLGNLAARFSTLQSGSRQANWVIP